ncbi:MAG: 1-(5-phosphoribosyl)-5-amino-4-imidazole-carboxylate carboxylase, partial [Acidobacteria bacterium]
MNLPPLRELLDRIEAGRLSAAEAEAKLLEYLRDLPYEDLGFARVDHHRAIRQGMPEVVFGLGKTPAQIAAIAAAIARRGNTLLVTRADEPAYLAVDSVVTKTDFHHEAQAIKCRIG